MAAFCKASASLASALRRRDRVSNKFFRLSLNSVVMALASASPSLPTRRGALPIRDSAAFWLFLMVCSARPAAKVFAALFATTCLAVLSVLITSSGFLAFLPATLPTISVPLALSMAAKISSYLSDIPVSFLAISFLSSLSAPFLGFSLANSFALSDLSTSRSASFSASSICLMLPSSTLAYSSGILPEAGFDTALYAATASSTEVINSLASSGSSARNVAATSALPNSFAASPATSRLPLTALGMAPVVLTLCANLSISAPLSSFGSVSSFKMLTFTLRVAFSIASASPDKIAFSRGTARSSSFDAIRAIF